MGQATVTDISPQILHVETHCSDEISDLVPDWSQEYIQLKKGKFYWENIIIQIGEFQFIEEVFSSPTLARGQTSKNTFAIGIPQTPIGMNSYLGEEITNHTLLTANHQNNFDLRIESQFKHFIMVAPVDEILAYAAKLRLPLDIEGHFVTGTILSSPETFHYLSNYFNNLFCMAKKQP